MLARATCSAPTPVAVASTPRRRAGRLHSLLPADLMSAILYHLHLPKAPWLHPPPSLREGEMDEVRALDLGLCGRRRRWGLDLAYAEGGGSDSGASYAASATALLLVAVLLVAGSPRCRAAPQGALVTRVLDFDGVLPCKHYSGYMTVDEQHERRLFYYLVEQK